MGVLRVVCGVLVQWKVAGEMVVAKSVLGEGGVGSYRFVPEQTAPCP